MKHISKIFSFLVLLLMASGYSAAQNTLTIHMSDTAVQVYRVDSIYYDIDDGGTLVQTVVTKDTIYTFFINEIDSITYQGARKVSGGVVHGAVGDSLFVVSITDAQPLEDTSFTLMTLAAEGNQLLAVANADTMPIMLYRGPVGDSVQVVIDTLSTVVALVMCYPQVATMADTDYAAFDSLLHQADSFSVLYNLVGLSIASRRPLSDTLNMRMFEVLGDVIAQIVDLDSEPLPMAKANFLMGNNTMSVQTAGSTVNMRMWDLNPAYIGTVSDAEGNVLVNNLRVPARADYGVMDIFRNQTFYGEYTSFDMTQGGEGAKYFELSCKSLPAQIDFYLSAFVLPAISFFGLSDGNGYQGNCIRNAAVSIAEGFISGQLENVLRSGSANPTATAEYNDAFWAMMRGNNSHEVRDALSVGVPRPKLHRLHTLGQTEDNRRPALHIHTCVYRGKDSNQHQRTLSLLLPRGTRQHLILHGTLQRYHRTPMLGTGTDVLGWQRSAGRTRLSLARACSV